MQIFVHLLLLCGDCSRRECLVQQPSASRSCLTLAFRQVLDSPAALTNNDFPEQRRRAGALWVECEETLARIRIACVPSSEGAKKSLRLGAVGAALGVNSGRPSSTYGDETSVSWNRIRSGVGALGLGILGVLIACVRSRGFRSGIGGFCGFRW
ncbi:hypothetical protein DFH11DRAFT_1639452 [Phellopilus nigrolimitatus]|nr:hypothetical protein DFH11DRAFT_1639452 [Phellopilus nigrolimitatus]